MSKNVQMSPSWGRIEGEAGNPISPACICESIAESRHGERYSGNKEHRLVLYICFYSC